ncbi:MAG TPA: sugar phosphate nucleotidyltransferase [Gemmatimonadales bacterium]|nr:sugar phosphate nucleotidyltransferase [Gemmatimonadales bacterium]
MDWAVLLAGGSGTRFWPLSSPRRPKQLLPLAGDVPTAIATARAVEPLVSRKRILVVAGADLAPKLAAALDLPPEQILVEPKAASTAPALAWATATALARDPSATLLSMHADWYLADPERFRRAADAALEAARMDDALVTVGVVPTRVEPGYGHIVPGEIIRGPLYRVARFVEKPPRPEAESLTASGALWNSGLFAWTAGRFLDELRQHAPEVSGPMMRLAEGDVAAFFDEVSPVAIDVALFERSERVIMLRGDFPWDDVGNWEAIARVRPADAEGNVLRGPVSAVDAARSIAWSDGTPVVLAGVKDVVVVAANGRILVLDRSRAGDMKEVLESLPPDVRTLE